MAPTTAPTHVLTGCICFSGVYTNAYRTRLEAASPAAKPLACTNLAKFCMFSSSVSFLSTYAAEHFRKKVHICMYKMQRESKNLPGQQSCSCSSNTRSPHGSMCRTNSTWRQGPPHCPFHFGIIFYLEHLKVGVNDQRESWVVLAVKATTTSSLSPLSRR